MRYRLYCTDLHGTEINAAMTIGVEPQVSFIFDPMNSDYQEFLRWCEAGNEPLPPDSQE